MFKYNNHYQSFNCLIEGPYPNLTLYGIQLILVSASFETDKPIVENTAHPLRFWILDHCFETSNHFCSIGPFAKTKHMKLSPHTSI